MNLRTKACILIAGFGTIGPLVLNWHQKDAEIAPTKQKEVKKVEQILTCEFTERKEFNDKSVCLYICPDNTKTQVRNVVHCLDKVPK